MKRLRQKPPKAIKTVIITLVVMGLVLWGLIALGTQPPKPQVTTYEATLGRYGVLDPKTVYVKVGVKNTGAVAHAASCFLTVTSESGAYTGSEIFKTRELQPGEEETYTANVDVKDEGAAYITGGHVECEDK